MGAVGVSRSPRSTTYCGEIKVVLPARSTAACMLTRQLREYLTLSLAIMHAAEDRIQLR